MINPINQASNNLLSVTPESDLSGLHLFLKIVFLLFLIVAYFSIMRCAFYEEYKYRKRNKDNRIPADSFNQVKDDENDP